MQCGAGSVYCAAETVAMIIGVAEEESKHSAKKAILLRPETGEQHENVRRLSELGSLIPEGPAGGNI